MSRDPAATQRQGRRHAEVHIRSFPYDCLQILSGCDDKSEAKAAVQKSTKEELELEYRLLRKNWEERMRAKDFNTSTENAVETKETPTPVTDAVYRHAESGTLRIFYKDTVQFTYSGTDMNVDMAIPYYVSGQTVYIVSEGYSGKPERTSTLEIRDGGNTLVGTDGTVYERVK